MSCGRYQIRADGALRCRVKIATIHRMRSVGVMPSLNSTLAYAFVACVLLTICTSFAIAIDPPAQPETTPPSATPVAPVVVPPAPVVVPPAPVVVPPAPVVVPPAPVVVPPAPVVVPPEPTDLDPHAAATGTRVHVIVDRFSEFGGTIVSQTTEELVLKEPSGRMRTILKARIYEVVPLLDDPERTRVETEFRDGRRQVGLLINDGFEHLTIEIGGIHTTYKRVLVMRTIAIPTDEELYQRAKIAIEPDQYSARFGLCVWLHDRKMYEEAEAELHSLLEATDHYDAKQLLIEVTAQLKLAAETRAKSENVEAGDGGNDANTDPPTPSSPRDRAAEQMKGRILTSDEVNLIRVYEMDLAKPPKVEVDDSLIRAIFEKYATDPLVPSSSAERAMWFSKEPIEVVKLLFALKAREFYSRVEVRTEPTSLNVFRTKIHNAWLINNCATSRCHGGVDAGRFFLHTRDWKDSRVRYTNLLLLEKSSLDGRPLIDFDEPAMSLLYQMALPRTEARIPHPAVRGWEPVFTSGRKALADDFLLWAREMRHPRPVYPIEYVPPRLRESGSVGTSGNDR